MASLQTETAIETLSDLFGKPKWELNPPEGFNRDVFLSGWDEELRKYSETQVKKACLRYGKYAKTRTFPTLMHIMAQLVDEEPEPQEKTPETKKNTFMDELEQYRARCIQDGVDGRLCLSADVDEALRKTMDEIDAEYPRDFPQRERSASEAIGLGLKNKVFWEKLDLFLRAVTAKNAAYVPSDGQTERKRSIPTQFSFDETMRKTA